MEGCVSNMKRFVAYIDLLGFSSYVSRDHREKDDAADHMLQEMTQVMSTRYGDTKQHNISCYPDAFEAFIPVSDGVFITGEDPAKTLQQIAFFLCDCFKANSYRINDCTNPALPTEVEITILDLKGNVTTRKSHAHPIIFRGGASYDELFYMRSLYMFSGQLPMYCNDNQQSASYELRPFINLIGKSVVDAASFDKSKLYKGTGPRLYIHDNLYDELVAQKAREVLDFIELETKKDEHGEDVTLRYLLWPAYSMNMNNPIDHETPQYWVDILKPAIKIWLAYKNANDENEPQYRKFVELCLDSYRAWAIAKGNANRQNNCQTAKNDLIDFINNHEMGESKKEILRKLLNKELELASNRSK